MNTKEKRIEEIDIWYKIHGIVFEKAELYCDFFISLIDLMENTYLGEDVMTTHERMFNHYRWCFNATIDNFEKEKIFFERKGDHFEHLWKFFEESFYTANTPSRIRLLKSFLKNILDINHTKTDYEMNMMKQFYNILDKNLKNWK